MIFKKQKLDILEAVAKQNGVTVAEVRHEIELAIAEAQKNPDPEKQAEFKRLFGDRTPTPAEFIQTVSLEIAKK